MKKSELSVGLRVELANGHLGTVVDVDGWSRGDAGNWSTYTIPTERGRNVRVIGNAGGDDVVVVWDHGPVVDGMRYGSIVSPRGLRPVGVFAAAQAEQEAEEAEARAFDLRVADIARDRLRARWGDRTDLLLDALDVPAEGMLDSVQHEALSVAITCWDLLNGQED